MLPSARGDVVLKDVSVSVAMIRRSERSGVGMEEAEISFTVWSGPQIATAVEEPYSTVSCGQSRLKHTGLPHMHDIETLCSICRWKVHGGRPTYTNLNRLLAQVISSTPASLRFEGALNIDNAEFQADTAPFTRARFMPSSYVVSLRWQRWWGLGRT